MKGNVIIEPKSDYGKEKIFNHGKEYEYIKIVEYYYTGDFLVMIKSIKDQTKLLVNLESDKDFTLKIFNN